MHWELEVWLARALEAAMSPRADNDDVEMMGGGPVKNLGVYCCLPVRAVFHLGNQNEGNILAARYCESP